MSFINQVGNALTGLTGTGAFVGANTPTLITPVLGAATATSINFGGSTLNTYASGGTFVPTLGFGTGGDESWSYALQQGNYTVVGNVVFVFIYIIATPTYTTAAGYCQIASLPFTVQSTSNYSPPFSISIACNGAWPTNVTAPLCYAIGATTTCYMYGTGSGAGAPSPANQFGVAQFTSGNSLTIFASGCYFK